jgi:hypothetical protein
MSFTSKISRDENTYKVVSGVVHHLCETHGLDFNEQWATISRKTTEQLDRHYRKMRRQNNPLSQIKQRRIAYSFFTAEKRNSIAAKHPELSFGDVSKLVGKEWNSLSDKQKAKYVKMEAADKERYEAEKAAVLAQQASATQATPVETPTQEAAPATTPAKTRRSRKQEATPAPAQEAAPATPTPSKSRGGRKNRRARK